MPRQVVIDDYSKGGDVVKDSTCRYCRKNPIMPRSEMCQECFDALKASGSGMIFTAAEYVPYVGPLIFEAGPIQGARDWHSEGMRIIRGIDPAMNVASPRRYTSKKPGDYREQTDWETFHLNAAGYGQGCVLFWLAREEKRELAEQMLELIERWRTGEDARAHAQTSRVEFSRWCERRRDGAIIVIGIETGFTGEKYIRTTFPDEYPGILLPDSLEETCRVAVELANEKPADELGKVLNRNLEALYKSGAVDQKWFITDKYGILYSADDDLMKAAKIAGEKGRDCRTLTVHSGFHTPGVTEIPTC